MRKLKRLPAHLLHTEQAVRAWLCVVARSIFLTQRRRVGRVSFDSDLTNARLMYEGGGGSQEAHVRLLEAERLLTRLSPRTSRLLVMRALGYTYDEMAEETGMEMGTVKSAVSRGLARLTQMVEGGEPLAVGARARRTPSAGAPHPGAPREFFP